MKRFLSLLVLGCMLCTNAHAVFLVVDTIQSPTPLADTMLWLPDPAGTYTIDQVNAPQLQGQFLPLKQGIHVTQQGPVWLKLSLGKTQAQPLDSRALSTPPLAINLGEFSGGKAQIYLRESGTGVIAHTRWTKTEAAPNEYFSLPSLGATPQVLFIRLAEAPGLWFHPVISPHSDVAPPIIPTDTLLPILLIVLGGLCLIRAIKEQAAWRLWAALFLFFVLGSVAAPMPLLYKPYTYTDLPALLGAGLALFLLPNIARGMLATENNAPFQDNLLLVFSLLGIPLALAPLVPGIQWLARLLPLWPLLLLPLFPLCIWALQDKRKGALAFTGICVMPFIGALLAFFAIDSAMPHAMAVQGSYWGIAIGGIGLLLTTGTHQHSKAPSANSTQSATPDPLVLDFPFTAEGKKPNLTEELTSKDTEADGAALSSADLAGENNTIPRLEMPATATDAALSLHTQEPIFTLEQQDTTHEKTQFATLATDTESLSALIQNTPPAYENIEEQATADTTPELVSQEPLPHAAPLSASEHATSLSDPVQIELAQEALDIPVTQDEEGGAPFALAPSEAVPDIFFPSTKVINTTPFIPNDLNASWAKNLSESLFPEESARPRAMDSNAFNYVVPFRLKSPQQKAAKLDISVPFTLKSTNSTTETLSLTGSAEQTHEKTRELFSLTELVSKASEELEPRIKEKGIVFSWVVDPRLPALLCGNAEEVYAALYTLLHDAIDTTLSGFVQLTVRSIGLVDCCKVTLSLNITDTKPEERVMRGLQTSKAFANKHDGNLTVEYNENKGLLITVTLVFATPSPTELSRHHQSAGSVALFQPVEYNAALNETHIEKPEPALPQGEQATVLVVNLTTSNMRLIAHYLHQEGHRYIEVQNENMLVQSFQQQPIDLVIVDADMPEADLREAVRNIRAQESTSNLQPAPILALTSHYGQTARMLELGCAHTLQKPFTTDEFTQTLHNCLRQSEHTPPQHNQQAASATDYVSQLLQGTSFDPQRTQSQAQTYATNAPEGEGEPSQRRSLAERIAIAKGLLPPSSTPRTPRNAAEQREQAPHGTRLSLVERIAKAKANHTQMPTAQATLAETVTPPTEQLLSERIGKAKEKQARSHAEEASISQAPPAIDAKNNHQSSQAETESSLAEPMASAKKETAPADAAQQPAAAAPTQAETESSLAEPIANAKKETAPAAAAPAQKSTEPSLVERLANAKEKAAPTDAEQDATLTEPAQGDAEPSLVERIAKAKEASPHKKQQRKAKEKHVSIVLVPPQPKTPPTEKEEKTSKKTQKVIVKPPLVARIAKAKEQKKDAVNPLRTTPLPGIKNEEILCTMLPLSQTLLHSLQTTLHLYEANLEKQDFAAIAEALEQLRSKTTEFGLHKLSKLIGYSEQAARASDAEAVATLLEDFKEWVRKYRSSIETCFHNYLKNPMDF